MNGNGSRQNDIGETYVYFHPDSHLFQITEEQNTATPIACVLGNFHGCHRLGVKYKPVIRYRSVQNLFNTPFNR